MTAPTRSAKGRALACLIVARLLLEIAKLYVRVAETIMPDLKPN